MSKIAAFYYSQTGQGTDILQSVCRPLTAAGHELVCKEIVPETDFPFPWSAGSFFEAFPESREGMTCPIRQITLDDVQDAALVIIVYPAWFLSPAIPLNAFFQDEQVRTFLNGKHIVTIDGCRNMWVMAHQKVKTYIEQCGGKLCGNIVLQDMHPNLVSVITIVRWLMGGIKEKKGVFPAAGVSSEDIEHAAVFGETIAEALAGIGFIGLQERLMKQGAICYKPHIVFIEKAGHRIFGIWSKFVLRKGSYGAPERAFRLRLFKYYLFAVLYLASPIGLVVFYLTYPFRCKAIKRDRQKQCYE
ncbi:MAG: hypothetical protein LBV39_02335 [Bacteroidales bacterium]|jgi:hypothetical protein|nr:hypothetical protein [Bacteroidales bacterium]